MSDAAHAASLATAQLERIMGAPIESLSEDERRTRWQALEGRFEYAERQASEHLAELQAFATRCFEVDAWRREHGQDPS